MKEKNEFLLEDCIHEINKVDALEFTYEIKQEANDISNVKCEGIVADKIYDCIYLTSNQVSVKNEEFTIITEGEEDYTVGDKISIEKFDIFYNFIGIMEDYKDGVNNNEDFICVEVDGSKVDLVGSKESAHEIREIPVENKEEKIPEVITIYREFNGYFKRNSNSNFRVSIFKHGVRYFIDGLEIKISGKIGCKTFEGIKSYKKYDIDRDGNYIISNPAEITSLDRVNEYKNEEVDFPEVGLNFSPVNLCGDLNIPNNNRRVQLKIKLDSRLSIENILPFSRYMGGNTLNGLVKYSFLVTQKIYHSTKEKIGVFIDKKGVICNKRVSEENM